MEKTKNTVASSTEKKPIQESYFAQKDREDEMYADALVRGLKRALAEKQAQT